MNYKIIFLSLITTIFLINFVLAITNINPDVAYPETEIELSISPNKKFGFYNIIYVHDSEDLVVDLINIPCDTVCKSRQNIAYSIPTNFLGNYYFATYDYEIEDYELDSFSVIEQGGAEGGTLTIQEIKNSGSDINFLISPEQGQKANIEILTTLKSKSCENYNVKTYLCEPDLFTTCSSEIYTYNIPLNFISKTGQTCNFNYIGADYFPFYEVPGDWKIISQSGATYDETNFIYAELKAMNYPSSINFGTLNANMWNTGIPAEGIDLINHGNIPLTIDWQCNGGIYH